MVKYLFHHKRDIYWKKVKKRTCLFDVIVFKEFFNRNDTSKVTCTLNKVGKERVSLLCGYLAD